MNQFIKKNSLPVLYMAVVTLLAVLQVGCAGPKSIDLSRGGVIKIKKGTYKIDALNPIKIPSNTTVICAEGVVFECIPNGSNKYCLFEISNAQNVVFKGGKIVGDRNQHTGTSGEHGMGISILDSKNVVIEGVEICDTWGDAIYIGSNYGHKGGRSENVAIRSCTLYNCRRQGISVVGCKGLTVDDCEIYGINGTAPQAGIDFEVNYKDYPNQDSYVSNCRIHDCQGPSIVVGNPIDGLSVADCECDNFQSYRFSKGLSLTNSTFSSVIIGGDAEQHVKNCQVSDLIVANYCNASIDDCKFRRVVTTKNSDVANSALNIRLKFNNCYFESKTSNLSQKGDYAHETMFYTPYPIASLSFENCEFLLKDAWGITITCTGLISMNGNKFDYTPASISEWGSGYGFLHLKSTKGKIVLTDNYIGLSKLTVYTAYGLIRAYANDVRIEGNTIETSVKNLGTAAFRVNDKDLNKTATIKNNNIKNYSKEYISTSTLKVIKN